MKVLTPIILALVIVPALVLAASHVNRNDNDKQCRKLAREAGKSEAELAKYGKFWALTNIKSQGDCDYWCKNIWFDIALVFPKVQVCCCANEKRLSS